MTIGTAQPPVSSDLGTSSSTTALAYGSNVSAGSTLVALTAGNAAGVPTGVADTLSNTWTLRQTAQSSAGPGNQKFYIYTAPSPSGGANTVTITYGVSTTFRPIYLLEISGAAASAYDVGNNNDQTLPTTGADAVVSGSATNTKQPALIIGASFRLLNTGQPAAGTGFSAQTGNWGGAGTGSGLLVETKRITTTGSQQATFTAAANAEHMSLMIILDELLGVTFRKTLSGIGGRVGARQLQA